MLSVVLFGSMSASLEEECSGAVRPLKLTPRVAELSPSGVRRGRFFQRSELIESLWNQDERDTLNGTVNTALLAAARCDRTLASKTGRHISSTT